MAEQSELSVLISGRDQLSPVFNQLESKLIRFVGAVSSAIAAVKLITLPVVSSSNFEREMANVTKTTGFTKSQVDALGDSLLELSLRLDVSSVDLAKIAAAAGQQGLGREGVEGIKVFTESVARMASVLDISAAQAAADVGKILNIFKIPIQDVERVSSAFNQVSNNSTAKGTELLNIVKRIGDAAREAGNDAGSLTNSIALAATGLDLGLNPEVIGTSFVKIFSQFSTKSKEFSALLRSDRIKDEKDWIDIVAKNGLEALQIYNAKLRTMTRPEQAKAIAMLSGTGRIFGLETKLVQDTLDKVLQKNLSNAQQGYSSALSSIREQSTVLNTVNAQMEILSNSFVKLGTDGATPILGSLKVAISELSSGLQSDGIKSFVAAAGQALGDLIAMLSRGVKEVASWNINWNNFIIVIKVFIGLKLVEALVAVAARLPIISAGLQLIARSSAEAGRVSLAAMTAEALGIDRLIAKRRALLAAKTQAALLERELAIATLAQENARNALAPVAQSIRPLTLAAQAARNASTAADANRVAILAANDAKIQASTVAHETRVNAIKAQYQGQRTAAALAAKAAELQAEERFYTRSITSLNVHNARRNAASAEAAAIALAQTNATNAALLAAQAAHAAKVREIQAASLATIQANNALLAANAGVASAAVGLGAYAVAFGRILSTVFRFVLSAALWITIIYSIADAFGALDKVKPLFLGITDALGLTSEAQRKLADETRKANEEWRKNRTEIDEVTGAYKRLLDASGRIEKKTLDAQLADFTGTTDPTQRRKKLLELASQASAARIVEEDSRGLTSKEFDPAETQAKIDKLKADRVVQYAKLEKANQGVSSVIGASRQVANEAKEEAEAEIAKLTAEISKFIRVINLNRAATKDGREATQKNSQDNLQAHGEQLIQLFTAPAFEIAKDTAIKLSEQRAQLDEIVKARGSQPIVVGNRDEAEVQRKLEERALSDEESKARENVIRSKIGELEAKQAALVDAQKEGPARNSAKVASDVSTLPPKEAKALVASIDDALKKGFKFGDGSVAGSGVATPPSSGTAGGPPTNKELNEAQKLARAKSARAAQEAEDALRLAKIQADELLKINQDQYNQGLLDLDTYYRAIEKARLAENAGEIKANETKIAAKKVERGDVEGSARFKVDTEIASMQQEIVRLNVQRKFIVDETARDIANARVAFSDSTKEGELALLKFFGIDKVQEFFEKQLAGYVASSRVERAKLSSSLVGQQGPDRDRTQKQIDDLDSRNALSAYADTMSEFARNTALADSEYARFVSTLQVLKTKGGITDAQVVAQELVARKSLLEALLAEIEVRKVGLTPITDKNSVAYKNEVAAIDALVLRYNQLKNSADATAQSVNQSVENSIVNALTEQLGPRKENETKRQADADLAAIKLTSDAQSKSLTDLQAQRDRMSVQSIANSNIDNQIAAGNKALNDLRTRAAEVRKKAAEDDYYSFVNTVKRMANTVLTTMLEIVNKQIAQNLVDGLLGGGGNGGIGGLFSSILGFGNGKSDKPTGSKAAPFHVIDANKPGVTATGDGIVADLENTLTKQITTVFSDLYDSVGTAMGEFGTYLSDTLSSIFSSLQSSGSGSESGGGWMQWVQAAWNVYAGSSGGGGGGGGGGMDTTLFHGGGIIGGQGSANRSVSPSLFNGAMRYHTGGIAGMQPDEVAIIGKRGEEVLTEDDPRHRKNGGAMTSDGGEVTNNNVTVNITDSGNSETTSNDTKTAEFGRLIARIVQSEIMNQKRPGGMLA